MIFDGWDVSRRMRAIELMDGYLRKNASPSDYEIQWVKYGAHPWQKTRMEEICKDDEKFIDAVFNFYVCLTTDLSWIRG